MENVAIYGLAFLGFCLFCYVVGFFASGKTAYKRGEAVGYSDANNSKKLANFSISASQQLPDVDFLSSQVTCLPSAKKVTDTQLGFFLLCCLLTPLGAFLLGVRHKAGSAWKAGYEAGCKLYQEPDVTFEPGTSGLMEKPKHYNRPRNVFEMIFSK